MKKLFFTLILLASFLVPISAQQSEKSSFESDCEGYDMLTLYDSTNIFMEESGLSHVIVHKRYRILSQAGGRDYNTVKMDYDPLSAYAEIRDVRIFRQNGNEERVENAVMDYPAPAHMIYWGARQKMVTLGRLEPGDEVEIVTYKKGFTYALLQGEDPDAKYIPPMRGHFYDIVPFWSEQPVKEKVYQVSVLTSKNLRYAVYHGSVETKTQKDGDRTLYVFTKKNIMPIERIPRNTLANNDIQTKLLLSTAQTWEAKSMWFYGVNEDYGSFVPTDEVKDKVAQLLKKAKSENDSIFILTHWVADNMRYSGISMGEGEGFTLHKCDMNYTDRCGVCKDKAGLLIAMLRAAGFQAYAAMTMAGEQIDDIPADQFNHCVTVVKRRNGNFQLLDPTWVPGVRELWSSAEQQQNFLMGLPQGAKLGITPVSKAENHSVDMRAVTKINKNGDLTARVTITAEGQSDRTVRVLLFSGRQSEWKSRVENQVLSLYPNAEIQSVKYSDEETYLQHPVKVTYKFRVPGYATVTDDEIIVIPLLAKGFFKSAMSHLYFDTSMETREYPFKDRCSRLVRISETMTLPAGYTSATYPKARHIKTDAVAFDGGYRMENGKLLFQETIRLGKRVYEASDWPAFRSAVENQRAYMDKPVIFQK